MSRWKKYTLITVGTILGLLLLSMLIVPWQIKVQGSKWFAENTTRQLTIENAFFNPFALTVEVKGVKLSEQQSTESFVSFDRLMLSGSARSLIDLAVILDRIELDNPFVNIELLDKQEFNFSDFTRLGADQPAPPPSEEPSEPLLFSFNNIIISGGEIDFTDLTSDKKSQHQIKELALTVPFIGNVPYLTDKYVEPQLRLLLNGSEVAADGQLKPFHESLETSLALVMNDLDLAFYAYHSPVPLPVEVASGSLDTEIDLNYRISADEQPQLQLSGVAALSDIDIRQLDDEPLFRLPTLILELGQSELLQQDFRLASLEIYQPELYVNRDASGSWNVQQLFPANSQSDAAAQEPPSAAEQQSKTPLPLLVAQQVRLVDGQVHFRDAYPNGGFAEEIQAINLQLDNLSTHSGELTELAFKLNSSRDTTFELSGQVGLNPLSASLALQLDSLPLQPHYPYLAELLTRPPEGRLTLSTNISLGPETSLNLDQLQLTLLQLQVPFTDQDYLSLADLSVTGGSFNLQQQTVQLSGINLSNGELHARRNADGSLSPMALLKPRQTEPVSEPETASAEPLIVTLPWQEQALEIDPTAFKLALDEFALKQFNLQLTDASLARQPQLQIADLNIGLSDLSYPESKQSPFEVNARIGTKGTLSLAGKLAHSPLRVQAQNQIKGLALTDFNGFLPGNVKISLKDGRLYTNLTLSLAEQAEQFGGSFSGDVAIADFNLRDPLSDGELLTWENLNLAGIKGELAPFKLEVSEVSLSQYLAKILIDEQGRINLANVTETQAADDGQQSPPEPEPEPEAVSKPVEVAAQEPADESTPPADIRIDALTLQGGTVSFTDRSMPTAFSATMYKLGGRVTGMASDPEMQADVDLRGELENHSPLTVSGKINPLSKDLYADLTISFKDIDLVPMTPYSGTYLGKVIDKGKLYLDLSYHIEHQQIKADNQIMIDQFTLGESVESDKATSLPIGLAIALLKDSNDEIHLDVPISGDLNDPSFSVAGAIFTVLKNLLVKAATAPFSLLTSMFAGGDEDFKSVTFTNGQARLAEQQAENLEKLSAMLAKRPALTLEISAYVNPERDPEAYRREQLRQKMVDAKWLDIKDEEQAPASKEQVSIDPEEYSEYLLQVYEEADFPRPRNFLGMLKELPEAEMEKLLLANIRAEEAEMQALAQARASVVRDQLIAANPQVKPQIFLKSVDIYQPPESGPASRVEFSIAAK